MLLIVILANKILESVDELAETHDRVNVHTIFCVDVVS